MTINYSYYYHKNSCNYYNLGIIYSHFLEQSDNHIKYGFWVTCNYYYIVEHKNEKLFSQCGARDYEHNQWVVRD